MCQTRTHDYYIDYLQGLANEKVEADQRQALIEKALALPLADRLVLWRKMSVGIAKLLIILAFRRTKQLVASFL